MPGRPAIQLNKAIIPATAGLLIFVALPLLAWGPAHLGAFFDAPARFVYVVVAGFLTIVIATVVPPPSASRGVAGRAVRRQRLAVVLLQVLGLAIVVVAPWSDRHGLLVLSAPGARSLGLVLFVLGHIFVAWAQVTLGPQFSIEVTLQQQHALVTQGLYRVVRHPRYLGIVVFTSGLGLVFRSGLALLLVCAEALVLLWRIRDEEALLRQEFGAEWVAYASATWRLVPFVY